MLIPEKLSILFNVDQIIIYLVIALLNSVLILFTTGKFYLSMQQCAYHEREYKRWLTKKGNNGYLLRLTVLCLLAFLFFLMLTLTCKPFASIYSAYIGFVSYVFFMAVYFGTEKHVTAKLPLKKTKRMVRLVLMHLFLIILLSVIMEVACNILAFYIGVDEVWTMRYALLCFIPLLSPFVLSIAYYINEPFERFRRNRYIKITKRMLENSDVIKIGITGSFGKTSVKQILTTILSQKYRVLATPKSYNTPLGISMTVKKLDSTHDVFIAEMGARYKGDIADLASLVKPNYAVLTGVNIQHIETFGDEETIKETKYELFENLRPDGVGFFSADNDVAKELYDRFNGEKYKTSIDGNDDNLVTVKDVKISSTGTTFTLKIKGEEPIACTTTLLGTQNIKNICLAASVAYKMGMTPDEIVCGIGRLTAIKNRLQLLPNNKGITIIDDSYNSNVDGVKAALEVLNTFEGRKIVVTPGLVELGKYENMANLAFGKNLGEVADIVIIVGKHNAEMLIKGLFEAGKSKEDIYFAKNLAHGNEKLNEILQKGDVVLFENDLPDTYD